jgi:uncharacterized membrane protein
MHKTPTSGTESTDSQSTESPSHLPGLDPQSWNDERNFRKTYPMVWWGTLIGPPLIAISIVAYFCIAFGWASAVKLVSTVFFTFFVAGKFIILGGGIEHLERADFYSSAQLFAMVFVMDFLTVTFLVFHLGGLFKLPRVGKKMQAVADNGHMMLEAHPWMRRATFIGLVIFVAVPLAMTGSVGGAILGRLLGMSRLSTFVGVVIGNVVGIALMYLGSGVLREILKKDNPMLLLGGILVMCFVGYILLRRYQQSIRAAANKSEGV